MIKTVKKKVLDNKIEEKYKFIEIIVQYGKIYSGMIKETTSDSITIITSNDTKYLIFKEDYFTLDHEKVSEITLLTEDFQKTHKKLTKNIYDHLGIYVKGNKVNFLPRSVMLGLDEETKDIINIFTQLRLFEAEDLDIPDEGIELYLERKLNMTQIEKELKEKLRQ